MLVRTLSCGVVFAMLMVVPAAAQTPAPAAQTTPATPDTTTETRPALPTQSGDTGFWVVPSAEVLPAGRWSASFWGANNDARQGMTDYRNFGFTGAFGIADRAEVFASWNIIRIHRNVRNPTFVPSDPNFGGVAQEFPYVREGWSGNLRGPLSVGAKWAVISQARGDAMTIAPRLVFQFPVGPREASHDDYRLDAGVVASREFGQVFEASGTAAAVLRGDADEPGRVSVSDGIGWGLGATFPSRSPLRALVEWSGEVVIDRHAQVRGQALVADDGSVAPTLSLLRDTSTVKIGGVWQAPRGWFVHAGFNYTPGIRERVVGGREFNHTPFGLEFSVGWHPGAKVYMPPPPPAPVVREVIREVPAPAAPPPNRPPQFTVGVTCDPCILEPGQTSRLSATATDPDGDPLTFTWSAMQGALSSQTGQNTIWTAPQALGNYPVCVVASDNRGGTAQNCVTLQVIRRQALMFEDVHFDFDRFNLRPEALKILDAATQTLTQNPDVRITIEGHCDSIGTTEYNLALGERRANAVRDYLVQRGIMTARLRTVSYGEERPIADNNTAAGRAMNRRAALVVIIEQP